MRKSYRKSLIAIVTFLGGLYFFLEFVLPESFLKGTFGEEFVKYNEKISEGFVLIGAMAVLLGVINLLRYHGEVIVKSKKGWINSVALILTLFIAFGIEFGSFVIGEERSLQLTQVSNWAKFVEVVKKDFKETTGYQGDNVKAADRIDALRQDLEEFKLEGLFEPEEENKLTLEQLFKSANSQTLELTSAYKQLDAEQIDSFSTSLKSTLEKIGTLTFSISQKNVEKSTLSRAQSFNFRAFFTSLGAAMFSLLAFYVATAAYRSFRAKTLEAGIMMTAALLVVLGQIPHGPLYISEDLPAIREWLMNYLNTPAFRAILFGSLIAGLSMSIRMWTSLEDSPLDTEGEDA